MSAKELVNPGIPTGDARGAAKDWVYRNVSGHDGYVGAYLAGSINRMDDMSVMASWSDVDVMVVLQGDAPAKPGKLVHNGTLLEVTYLPVSLFRSPWSILADYHLAASVAAPGIIADPEGVLRSIRSVVAREFPRRDRVEVRIKSATRKVEEGLQAVQGSGSLPQQVMGWVFPTGVLTHVVLVAALRNPTVRRRYEAVREVLIEHGQAAVCADLLEVLGCAGWEREQAQRHLDALAPVFDAAARVNDAPFPYASDITSLARPISIDGSQDMIDRGFHREAVFWLVVTWCRALLILEHAGSELVDPWFDGFHRLLADLGIASVDDLSNRADAALDLLPRVVEVARDIANRTSELVEE